MSSRTLIKQIKKAPEKGVSKDIDYRDFFYIPVAPKDVEDSKAPNIKEDWEGPTVGDWTREENWYTYEETVEENWDRFGILEVDYHKKLLIIDFDIHKMSSEQKERIVEAVAKMPRTLIHKSQSGGLHFLYLIDNKEITDDGKLPFSLSTHVDNKLNGYVLSPYHCEDYSVLLKRDVVEITLEDIPNDLIKTKDTGEVEANRRELGNLKNRVRKLYTSNRKFRRLFDGESSSYPSRSEGDYALLGMLKVRGFTKREAKKVMDMSSRDKWHEDGEQYREHTLDSIY